jgi:hypothetical protein
VISFYEIAPEDGTSTSTMKVSNYERNQDVASVVSPITVKHLQQYI